MKKKSIKKQTEKKTSKVDEINLKTLTEQELYSLQYNIEREKKNREEKNEENYIDVIYMNDGCEGFYCPADKFHKIPSVDLHNLITQTLEQGSDIRFTLEKFEKNEYRAELARYEWQFEDTNDNTPTIEEDEE